MRIPIRLILLFTAAFLSYLSWKRITLGTIWDREMILRDRFDGINIPRDNLDFSVVRVQASKPDKTWKRIRPYVPIISNVLGSTYVEIGLYREGSRERFDLDEVRSSVKSNNVPIESIEWRYNEDKSASDKNNLDVVFNTVNPNDVEDAILRLGDILSENA